MKKIFMASVVTMVFALSAALLQMTSCKKANAQTTTNCPTATYPVTGVWEGTYQTDQVSHAPTYASFAIYPDGTFIKRCKVVGTAANDYSITRGAWTLAGTTFQYRDTTLIYSGGYVVEKGTLTFSNTGTFTNSTWQDVFGQTYTGTFQNMKRIN